MLVYPLTNGEDRTVRWAALVVSTVAALVIVALGAISIVSLPA